jgi:hypothetical protein
MAHDPLYEKVMKTNPPCSVCGKPIVDGLFTVVFGEFTCGRCNGRDPRYAQQQSNERFFGALFVFCVLAVGVGFALGSTNLAIGAGVLAGLCVLVAYGNRD